MGVFHAVDTIEEGTCATFCGLWLAEEPEINKDWDSVRGCELCKASIPQRGYQVACEVTGTVPSQTAGPRGPNKAAAEETLMVLVHAVENIQKGSCTAFCGVSLTSEPPRNRDWSAVDLCELCQGLIRKRAIFV